MWDAISAVMNSFNDFLWGWFMIYLSSRNSHFPHNSHKICTEKNF